MLIRMLENKIVSEDAHTTRQLLENKCYDIADTAARDLIHKEKAEYIDGESMISAMAEIYHAFNDDQKHGFMTCTDYLMTHPDIVKDLQILIGKLVVNDVIARKDARLIPTNPATYKAKGEPL